MTFEPDLTVLTGDNATGKTTLLDAIACAISAPLERFPYAKSKQLKGSDVRESVTALGSSFDKQVHFPATVSAVGVFDGEECSWSRSLNSVKQSRMTVADAKSILARSENMQGRVAQGDSDVVLPLIALYGTNRLHGGNATRSLTPARGSSRAMGYEQCVSAGIDERGLYAWFEKVTLWELQNRKESPELAAVKKAIASCLPPVGGNVEATVDYDLERRELVLAYMDVQGAYRRDSLHSMSDGYRGALSLVADIARRMAMLNPMLLDRVLETPGIVLIDEIDLHLHPLWQARILGDLRSTFPNIQFIVSTHAPAVVSSVRSSHIRLLDSEHAWMPSEETYGRDMNAIVDIVMKSSKRPAVIHELFEEFYVLLDKEQFDRAESALDEIERQIGSSDTELVAARTALALERDL